MYMYVQYSTLQYSAVLHVYCIYCILYITCACSVHTCTCKLTLIVATPLDDSELYFYVVL